MWFPGETVNLGVGQGYLQVTPLQLAHVAAVLAERGKSFQPRLMIGTRDASGRITPVAPIAGAADHRHQRGLLGLGAAGMHHATSLSGLAHLRLPAARAAFKTAQYPGGGQDRHRTGVHGLAQPALDSTRRKPSSCATTAWFIAFAPSTSRPSRSRYSSSMRFGASVRRPDRPPGHGYLPARPAGRAVSGAQPSPAPRPSGRPIAPRSRRRSTPMIEDTGIARTRRTLSAGRGCCWH